MIVAGGGDSILTDVDIADQPSSRGLVHDLEIDPEVVLAADPALVVKLQPGSYPLHSREFSESFFTEFVSRPGMDEMTAVQDGQVIHMNYYLAGG